MPPRFILLLIALLVWLAPLPPAEAATRIVKVVSPGGIEAWLVQEPSIPILSLDVAWRNAGSKLDPPGKTGLANFAADLLDEGAGDLDAAAFHARVDDLGLGYDFNAGRDTFRASLRTLSENRDAAWQLFSLAITRPRFDAEPMDRVRRQKLSEISRQEEEPETVASEALFAAAFPQHPYGQPPNGSAADLPRITRDDLQGFIRARLARDNMVIGVVGDITPAELAPLLDRTFGALPAKAAAAAVADIVPAPGRAPEVITRDVPQSVIAFAGPGVKRSDPDFYAAYLLTHVLGADSLTSRLGRAVRVQRGLVYSIYLETVPYDQSALELGGFATRNEKVGEALKLVRQVLADVREYGITAAELADAKTYLNGSFPLTLSSNARIAGFLVTCQLDRLGMDYLDRRAKLIDAVTLDDINRVARRLLDPEKLLVVVVGKPQGLGGSGAVSRP